MKYVSVNTVDAFLIFVLLFMVFNATFNNISFLLVDETRRKPPSVLLQVTDNLII